jgi:serine/threonine protein kinase/beta-lactam-binding protein with PASTA domain
MDMMQETKAGSVLDGRYQVLSAIAQGGMASVFLALDQRLNRRVAVKIIHSQLAQGEHGAQFLRRFRNEVTCAAAVANPHIVQVYDTGKVNNLPYLVMEYVRGTDLRHEIAQQRTLSVRSTCRILSQILDGLAAAHAAGITHRDMKPENILLTVRGSVKITDFGLARAVSQQTTGTTGLLLGTAAYLAPETIEDGTSTPASDIYSVGIMAYEMLTGSIPFMAENPVTTVFRHVSMDVPLITATDRQFPSSLSQFVSRLCARSPSGRPRNGEEALTLLNEIMSQLSPAQLNYQHVIAKLQHTRPLTGAQQLQHPLVEQSVPEPPSPAGSFPDNFPSGGTQILAHPGRAAHLAPSPRETHAPAKATAHNSSHHTAALSTVQPVHETSSAPTHRSGVPVILTLLVSLLVAAGIVIGGWYWWDQWGPGSLITVPAVPGITCMTSRNCSVAGGDWTRYRNLLDEHGITSSTHTAYSESVPKGKMLSLTPGVGARLSKKSAHVTVTLSRGPRPIAVPSVTGMTKQRATEQLHKAGLTFTITEQYSDSVAAGAVIATSPGAGQLVKKGATIHITLSRGPQMVTVPSVIGLSKADAVSRLQHLGLTVKTQPSLIGEHLHQIFSQSVAGGQRIRLHDTHGAPTVITLTVV